MDKPYLYKPPEQYSPMDKIIASHFEFKIMNKYMKKTGLGEAAEIINPFMHIFPLGIWPLYPFERDIENKLLAEAEEVLAALNERAKKAVAEFHPICRYLYKKQQQEKIKAAMAAEYCDAGSDDIENSNAASYAEGFLAGLQRGRDETAAKSNCTTNDDVPF